MQRVVLFTALSLWLVASFGLKAVRYSQSTSASILTNTDLQAPITAEGWIANPKLFQDKAHQRYVFDKSGCSQVLTLIVLGAGAESAGLIDEEFGGNLSYFQEDDVVAKPSVMLNSIAKLKHDLLGLLSPKRSAKHAIFAVAPKPPIIESDSCSGPSVAVWKRSLSP